MRDWIPKICFWRAKTASVEAKFWKQARQFWDVLKTKNNRARTSRLKQQNRRKKPDCWRSTNTGFFQR